MNFYIGGFADCTLKHRPEQKNISKNTIFSFYFLTADTLLEPVKKIIIKTSFATDTSSNFRSETYCKDLFFNPYPVDDMHFDSADRGVICCWAYCKAKVTAVQSIPLRVR